jgi:hypothetical protein
LDEIASVMRFGAQTFTLWDKAYSATLEYGYDFIPLSGFKTTTLSLDGTPSLGTWYSRISSRAFLKGKGKYFMFRYSFSPTVAETDILVSAFELGGKIPLRAAAA